MSKEQPPPRQTQGCEYQTPQQHPNGNSNGVVKWPQFITTMIGVVVALASAFWVISRYDLAQVYDRFDRLERIIHAGKIEENSDGKK